MKPKKIALVGFNLGGGGTARVMSTLSHFFYKQNIDVHNIIIHDEVGYVYSGSLLNLGKLKSRKNTFFNKAKRFVALRKYIKQNDFDFIIDFRFRKKVLQEYLISRFVYDIKRTIYTIHSSQLHIYLPKSSFWTHTIYGQAYKIVAITKAMKNMVGERFPNLNNVEFIYNPISTDKIIEKAEKKLDLDFDFILGAGHFDTSQKQFDKLIEAYAQSILPENNIKLVIIGKGKNEEVLKEKAAELNIKDEVCFLGFQDNPYKYMSKAKFFVLSSWHEGHPMVLIEALSCGTPVVSFDCPTGPAEVVQDGANGLLIEDQNLEKLITAMNVMVEDKELLSHCRSNTKASVEKFSVDVVGSQWLDIMNNKTIGS